MVGKFSKMAQGRFQTHVKEGEVDFDFLSEVAANLGAASELCERIHTARTVHQVLSPQARACIKRADQVWAGERWFGLLPECVALKVKLGKDVFATLRQLAQRPEEARIVLLASGDLGFFGVGGSVLKLLPPFLSAAQAGTWSRS